MDINRKQLARQVAKQKGYTIKGSLKFIDDLIDVIIDNMHQGNSVSIYGFGCFDMLERKAHVCPNRRGGEMFVVPAHFVPRFYPGVRMYTAVKEWEESHREADV